MTFPDQPPIIPDDQLPLAPSQPPERPESRARRRRARRQQAIPADAEGQAALLAALLRRAYPSYELFVFALLSGALLGLGYLLDSQAVLLVGILIAPLMTPWVGMLLAVYTGSLRFMFETAMALLISAMLVFLSGLMSGFAARIFLPRTFNNAFINSRLWIPELIVLALGAVLLTVSFVRSEAKPFLPSLVIAYAFFPPVSASAFGIGAGIDGLWPQGFLVFIVHFALVTLLGLATLFVLRLRSSFGGLILSGVTVLVTGAAMIFLMGAGPWSGTNAAPLPLATTTPTHRPTPSPVPVQALPATPKPSPIPLVETATFSASGTPTAVTSTPAATQSATESPTPTINASATPVYAKIYASDGGGAYLRKTPNGKYMITLDNGVTVQVMPDLQNMSGVMWAHVIATRNGEQYDGWMLQSVLITATPVPNWQPSSTPTGAITTAAITTTP